MGRRKKKFNFFPLYFIASRHLEFFLLTRKRPQVVSFRFRFFIQLRHFSLANSTAVDFFLPQLSSRFLVNNKSIVNYIRRAKTVEVMLRRRKENFSIFTRLKSAILFPAHYYLFSRGFNFRLSLYLLLFTLVFFSFPPPSISSFSQETLFFSTNWPNFTKTLILHCHLRYK